MIELGHQQLVSLVRLGAFTRRRFDPAQHHLEQRNPQIERRICFSSGPWQCAVADGVFPDLERFSGAQPVTVRAGRHRLGRVAGPKRGLDQLRPEPEDEIRRIARDCDDQQSGGNVGERFCRRVNLAQAVGGEHALGFGHVRRQPVGQRGYLFAVRRGAEKGYLAFDAHRDTAAARAIERNVAAMDIVEQVGCLLRQAISIVLDAGEVEHQFLQDFATGEARLELLAPLARLELERKHRAEQLANGAQVARQQARAVVMAGDQAPQFPRDDDRDRHRGIDPHVAQILAVDWRNVAQDRIAHVEWLAGTRIERRRQRCRVVIDLGDQPQPAFQIKRPRLLGNVRGRIVEVEERRELWRATFGDDPARAIGHEAVDHHPVIPGDLPHACGGHLA